MRIVSAIDRPLRDEHVLATDPPLSPFLPDVWNKRINAFAGRALSANALTDQQNARIGHQRLMGQSVSAGPVRGLDVAWVREINPENPTGVDAILVHAGFGLCESGEDIVIQTPRQIRVKDLPVYLPIAQRNQYFPDAQQLTVSDLPDSSIAGAPHLKALRSRCMVSSLGSIVEKVVPGVALPRVAILVAEPVVLEVAARGAPADPCTRDPRDDPYDDLRMVDGARLALYLWPEELLTNEGASGPDYSLPPRGRAFRNLLAHRIFSVERGFILGDAHPWERLGIPLGLLAFSDDWRVEFLDCASVVRAGGFPRPRSPLVRQAGSPFLWRARMTQFVEHMGDLDSAGVPARELALSLPMAPPVGFLPGDVFDSKTRRQSFFPEGFAVQAVPVPLEQIDVAVRESSSLRPFDLTQPDAVDLLIPVPERVYEPGLLLTAEIDPVFKETITRFKADRTGVLSRREMVRRRRDVLLESITGRNAEYAVKDPEEMADERMEPLGIEAVRQVSRSKVHSFKKAESTLPIDKADRLFMWVRIVEATKSLSIGLTSDKTPEMVKNLAVWEAPTAASPQPARPLPAVGSWMKLEVPAVVLAPPLATVQPPTSLIVSGMAFGQDGGTVEWGPAGKIDAADMETVYVADGVPAGATTEIDGQAGAWAWKSLRAEESPPPSVEDEFGTEGSVNGRKAIVLRPFRDRLAKGGMPTEDLALLTEGGVDGFVAEISARLKVLNDKVDLGFTRARADIYRVRQHMLGSDDASRLVTSPTLAEIAQRDEGARVTGEKIREFVASLPKEKVAGAVGAAGAPGVGAQPPGAEAPPGVSPQVNAVIRGRTAITLGQPLARLNMPVVPGRNTLSDRSAAVSATTDIGPVRAGFTNITLGRGTIAEQVVKPITTDFSSNFSIIGARAQLVSTVSFVGSDVQNQMPLPGYVERTVTVAERLKAPPAAIAYQFALSGKEELIATLVSLAADAKLKGSGLDEIEIPGKFLNPPKDPLDPVTLKKIASLKASEVGDTDVLRTGTEADEGSYFRAAASAIDNTIALMRLVEGRIAEFSNVLTDAQSVRASLSEWLAKADAKLRAIEAELAEARHDVSVASALLDEEQARINALNDRRAAILRDHAKVVVFRRPRMVDRVTVIPTATASPAFLEQPFAACLREHPGVPDELRQMAEEFRNAPAAWFPALAKVVDLFDRPDSVAALLTHIKTRAAQLAPVSEAPPTFAGPKMLQAVNRALFSSGQNLAPKRSLGLTLEPAMIQVEGLIASRNRVKAVSLLGDLIDSGHGRAEASRGAAQELEYITQTGACLHASFAEVPAVNRLAWAEVLSEFDAPVALRSLTALKDWQSLPADLRQEQQGLADFLYSRVDPANAEAVAAVDELVRVALLMAAHAPVDKLVAARIARPAPARPGTLFELSMDLSKARIGMAVTVQALAGGVLARAVVEDVAGGVAKARIKEATNPAAIIDDKAVVHVSEIFVPRMAVLPTLFGKR